ncbi:MAG: hypothetical protein VB083_02330 [Aminobacterium sp.]|uniref:hypothetical protein n=1 Tax=Aminobacterium sp. TaxID=1872491 RepID=UPI002B207033|nr:hypothetical protein [Aminobacterium sp.]MEA4876725.1 hypothetical protein [Aminobacterium sp.]
MKNLHWASSCEVIEIVSSADAVEAGDKAASNEATRLADKAIVATVIKALSLADKAIVATVSEPIKYAATNDTKETTSIAQTELTSASL